MRRITLTLLVGAMCLLVTSPTRAGDITAKELLEMCEDRGSDGDAICLGYITGVADLAHLLSVKVVAMLGDDGGDMTTLVAWCRPAGVTNGQMIEVVMRDLRAWPEKWHRPALGLILRSFKTSFPCS